MNVGKWSALYLGHWFCGCEDIIDGWHRPSVEVCPKCGCVRPQKVET